MRTSCFFNETLVNKELCDKIDNYLYNLNTKIKLDNKNTRLYATVYFKNYLMKNKFN